MAQAIVAADKPVHVYQLRDHDPSGIGAWTDFQRKVTDFPPDAEVTFRRLAIAPRPDRALEAIDPALRNDLATSPRQPADWAIITQASLV
jgi:hypothetical protein